LAAIGTETVWDAVKLLPQHGTSVFALFRTVLKKVYAFAIRFVMLSL
jgi:hypothetical protein